MGLREKLEARARVNLIVEEAAVQPDPDEKLYVREMCAQDSDSFEASRYKLTITAKEGGESDVTSTPDMTNERAKLLVRTLCDQAGNRLYGDDEAGYLGLLLPRNDADALYEQAHRINRLMRRRRPEKNDSAPPNGSSIGSPLLSANGTSAD